MRVGIFGGTFDPPHIAHAAVARHVADALELARMLWVPGSTPPHKQERRITRGDARLEMVRIAIASDPRFEVSDIEIRRGGVTYTVDTLRAVARARPGEELFFLIGADNLDEFLTWKEPSAILDLARLVVMTRPGYVGGPLPPFPEERIVRIEVPAIDISSSQIRARIRRGEPIQGLVEPRVEDYIRSHNLYVSQGGG